MDELFTLIDNNDVISFDMFDTLVKRFVFSPKDLFYVVEREFNEKFGLAKSFHDDRIAAERRLYTEEGAKQPTFSEIYESLARFGYSESEREFLQEAEKCAERRYIGVLESGRKYYDYAKSRGKTVILTSDMYHSEEFLSSVMHDLKYDFDAVYVSGDRKASKWTGTLYKLLKSDFAGKKILHVGDNRKSDYEMPAREGINSYFSERRKNCPPVSDPIVRAVAEQKSGDVLYDFGYSYFGPLLAGFARFIKEKFTDRDVILFLSRDGYIVKKVFDALYPGEKTVYLYASRRALINPSLGGEFEEIIDALFVGSRASWLEFLSKTNTCSDETKKLLISRRFDLCREYPLDEFKKNADFKAFYEESIRPVFERKAAEQRTLLSRYFSTVGGGAKKVGVVDIGWFGNMQNAIARLFPDVDLKGAYLGILSNKDDRFGYAFDVKGNLKNFYIEHFYNAFTELLFSAPHGSVLCYEDKDGKVSPVFDDESEVQEQIARIQQGALDFTQALVPFSDDFGKVNPDFFFDAFYDFPTAFLRKIAPLEFSDFSRRTLIAIRGKGVSRLKAYKKSVCKVGALRVNYGVNLSRLFAFLYKVKARRTLK